MSYNKINTSISVRERTFLSQNQFQQLLNARDDEAVALLLQNTPYHLTATELRDTDTIERKLTEALSAEYLFAFEEAPEPLVVDIFASKYMFHNLKVLLKIKATDFPLESLLIPIGRYSEESLKQLVSALESSTVDSFIVDEVRSTWTEYLDYQDTEAIDVGMDSAYFRYLKEISVRLNDPIIERVIDVMIDFFNITTAKRVAEQDMPNSAMYELMTTRGSMKVKEFIHLVRENNIEPWFDTVNTLEFGRQFDIQEEKMKNGTITAYQLEQLADQFMCALLDIGRLDTDGPLPLLRYLFGKELEVKNLRVVLSGRANRLDKEQIEERMRPIYDASNS